MDYMFSMESKMQNSSGHPLHESTEDTPSRLQQRSLSHLYMSSTATTTFSIIIVVAF